MRRIPVQEIQFNTTTTATQTTATQTTTPQPTTSHAGVVTRAVMSTVAALVLAAVILGFIWYQRRYNIRRPSEGATEAASEVEVTPFVSSRYEITHGNLMTETEWQRPQSGLYTTVAADVDAHTYSSPLGLHLQSPESVPVGLSDKELAQMRAEDIRSQPGIDTITVTPPGHASGSQYPSFPATATEQRRSPTSLPLFHTLQSQVNRLVWREMREPRAESLGSEAPPSYAEYDASHHHDGGGVPQ